MVTTNLEQPKIPAPCEKCIVVPICRRKPFKQLVKECNFIFDFFYKMMSPPLGHYTSWHVDKHPSLTSRHGSVLDALKPTEWYVLIYNENECIIMGSIDFAYVPAYAGKLIRFETTSPNPFPRRNNGSLTDYD